MPEKDNLVSSANKPDTARPDPHSVSRRNFLTQTGGLIAAVPTLGRGIQGAATPPS